MKNKKRNREVFSEHSYWQSYSDMLAALLLFFILIIAVTMAVYRQKTDDLKLTEEELYAAQAQLELTMEDLKKSKEELEISNEELKLSLAQLQEAYDERALTQEELEEAYLAMEKTQEELDATKSELQDIVGVRTDIIRELQATFDESSMTVDSQTGSITFSSDVLFRYNSATLTRESQEILKAAIPKYLSVLLQNQYRDYIAEIIVEGHTDTDGGYQSNMELSFQRANAVANFCLDESNGLSPTQIVQLQGLLTVNGRSYSDPVYLTGTSVAETANATSGTTSQASTETPTQNSTETEEKESAGGVIIQEIQRPDENQREYYGADIKNNMQQSEINMAASRRVEIKFRLKEDEMIEKLSRIIVEDTQATSEEEKQENENKWQETNRQ